MTNKRASIRRLKDAQPESAAPALSNAAASCGVGRSYSACIAATGDSVHWYHDNTYWLTSTFVNG